MQGKYANKDFLFVYNRMLQEPFTLDDCIISHEKLNLALHF